MDRKKRSTLNILGGFALLPLSYRGVDDLRSSLIRVNASSQQPKWVPAGAAPFFFDTRGLIVQSNGDGGDTAQREGFVWFGSYLLQRAGVKLELNLGAPWESVLHLLEDGSSGEFRRYPDPGPDDWWNKTSNFSRDQQTPIVAALGALGPRSTLERLWAAFDRRGRKCQNGEPGSVDHQNLFRRALAVEQVEAIGEAQDAAMVQTLRARGLADMDDVGSDLNFIVSLAAARLWPTAKANTIPPPSPYPPQSATVTRTVRAYVRTRPDNYGCYLERYRVEYKDVVKPEKMKNRVQQGIQDGWKPECHPIIGALRWYFRPETDAGWGPAALYEHVVQPWIDEYGA